MDLQIMKMTAINIKEETHFYPGHHISRLRKNELRKMWIIFFLEASRVNNNITQLIRFPVNKERNAREEASDVYRTDALK